MKILIFTKEDAPEMRGALDRGKELEEAGQTVEYYDTDDVEGISKAQLYDVYTTPSFVVARDDGSMIQVWRGKIPAKSEIEQVLDL